MSIITEFTTDAEEFALGHALDAVPEMRVEGERMVTHSPEWVMPFLWASGDDFEAFEAALDDDPTVDEWSTVDSFDGTRLYAFIWDDDVQRLLTAILDRHGMVMETMAKSGTWKLKIRFSDRDQLSALQEYFTDQGDAVTFESVYEPFAPQRGTFNLTEQQWEALVLALDEGYFEVPRRTSTNDLAEQLGISNTAVSERLRRATATLVTNALTFNSRPTQQTSGPQTDE